jgi:L-ascorbate metabolism protein UlaG (beta-lactamase superfamily)
MKVTKYEHACLVTQEGREQLVIDPGMFTRSLPPLERVVAVVITHMHQDHIDKTILEQIMSRNPLAEIYSTNEVAALLAPQKVRVVTGGQQVTAGQFSLSFTGGVHATIDTSLPKVENVGVIVNQKLYYPGDSLQHAEGDFEAIAVPSVAPWAKVSESMNFIRENNAKVYFPTHNGFLTEKGQLIYNGLCERAALARSAKFTYLRPTESIELL